MKRLLVAALLSVALLEGRCDAFQFSGICLGLSMRVDTSGFGCPANGQPANGNCYAGNGGCPPGNGGYPPGNGGYPPGNGGYPPGNGNGPPGNGNCPRGRGCLPPQGWSGKYPPPKMYGGMFASMQGQGASPSPYAMPMAPSYGYPQYQGNYGDYPQYQGNYGYPPNPGNYGGYPQYQGNYGYPSYQGNYGGSPQTSPSTQQSPSQVPVTPGISTLPPPTANPPTPPSK